MEEEADLALLDQHLLKTNLLSQRMTGILAQLDGRLSRLDKTIAPLGIQPLTRKGQNIDIILSHLAPTAHDRPQPQATDRSRSGQPQPPSRRIQEHLHAPALTPIASGSNTPADETAILVRGPDIMALGEFFAAFDSVAADLERMYKGFKEGRGGAREGGVRDLGKLVEVGFQGLCSLFIKLSQDGTGRLCDPAAFINSGAPTPPNYFPPLTSVQPLTSKMSAILSTQNYTASVVQPVFDQTMSQFAEMRGDWMSRSFGGMLARVEEVDEGGIWEGGRGKEKVKSLAALWDAMPVVAEAETLLITSLFLSSPPSALLPATLSLPLALLTSTLGPTLGTIKKKLSTHTFLALDLYTTLQAHSGKYETALSKCLSMTSSPYTPDIVTPLAQPLTTLRSLLLRSFPELLVDIRVTQEPGSGTSSAISEVTHSVLTYVEMLPMYEKTAEALLSAGRSERGWLMGIKEAPSPARSAGEEGGIVNLYIADVLGTLLSYLDQRARPMRRPIAQTFLLNNLSHIRNTTSNLDSDIVGPGAEGMLNKAFREAKGHYISEWNTLLNPLTLPNTSSSSSRFIPTPSLPSSERQQLKDAAVGFFDKLSEMEGIMQSYPFSRGDVDLREMVGKEVVGAVGDVYGSFWARCQGKGAEKYLRGSPDDVLKRVQALFR